MDFPHATGKGITNKSGCFAPLWPGNTRTLTIFSHHRAASHSYIFLCSGAIVKDVLCLLFQFETQFAGRDRAPVSGYKSARCVGEIEFPMNT